MPSLPFVTLDVFTTTPLLGNPLAIVHVPTDTQLTQEQKQKIAHEFNLSETVFVHGVSHLENTTHLGDVPINIFAPQREMSFAGHPTIGSACHLLTTFLKPSSETTLLSCTLITKAGRIPAVFDTQTRRGRLEVPHAITVHSNASIPRDKAATVLSISHLPPDSIIPNDVAGTGVALVSIVEDLAFILVRVTSLEVLGALPTSSSTSFKPRDFPGFENYKAAALTIYAYCIVEEGGSETQGTTKIRTRLIRPTWEDPATGSAASCLTGYLTLTAQPQTTDVRRFEVTQGVEMGRRSDIVLEVKAKTNEGSGPAIDKIWLEGTAVPVMNGTLTV
ncbi:Diaminopimelate epimerase-like protein [Clavulina sp. PMI_390]|nr:Diaminopimelate epimerase-like protein [Clavulina sp. PMI_390]